MSASTTFLLWLFTLFWIGKLFQYALDYRRLRNMQDFYEYLLGIPDADIQTIAWQDVISRLMTLRDSNPSTARAISARHKRFIGSQSKQRMDAHDIANRLMRKENYLIALFNKDILDLTLPIPFLRNRQLFSRTLEWNLNLCVMDYVFNEQGQVRPIFLKDTHRAALSEGLRRRFVFAGVMNIFMAPFIVAYFLLSYFFRYFNEYRKNPSQIGSRQYTPLAEWKFREFNELWHLFERRLKMSYEISNYYLGQFPKDKTVQLSRFVAFIAGALASVLAVASIVDPELIFSFELSADRTALFYLGVFGSIYAFARGNVPEETLVFEPEFALRQAIKYTHYQPTHWEGKLHSDDVRKDFAMLYQLKVVIFLEEILSIIFTPFVLWFSLPKCSDRLIDFFREFTVHVDGLGYVCSFALFDFKRGTNLPSHGQGGTTAGAGHHDPRDDYYSTKDGKMLASYYGFLENYVPNARAGPQDRGAQPPGGRHFPIHGPGAHSALRASQLGLPVPVAVHNSLMQSILLDPHHQPSTTGHRPAAAAAPHARYRTARQTQPATDTIRDEDEEMDARQVSSRPTTLSHEIDTTDDSQLEESWRLHLAGDVDPDEADEKEDVQAVVGGAGVLGLIQQFQKVSSEGRGAVGI
jgi:autophagy-related protein 9